VYFSLSHPRYLIQLNLFIWFICDEIITNFVILQFYLMIITEVHSCLQGEWQPQQNKMIQQNFIIVLPVTYHKRTG